SWSITALADKRTIQAALLAHEEAWDFDPDIVLSGGEVAEDRPDDWQLIAYLSREPDNADKQAVEALFADEPPRLQIEQMTDRDWLTESQQRVGPIEAGRFYVHTPNHRSSDNPALRNFAIPASQAFGTGHHATTAGCLAMLTHMKRTGIIARNLADIGTGTGLLAFAAMELWPRACATASDIDAVCEQVVIDNAAMNAVPRGPDRGQLAMVIANGMDDPQLQMRAPYDLLIANILAGPLTELVPDFMDAVAEGGDLLLAGLLTTQEARVRSAYRRAGFRLAKRLVRGDWSILWLRKRNGWRRNV
ncbi:MAG: 50S ribosomal protein L11 methyltransferase, partial [Pontixanthobacter sp.]